MKEKPKKSVRMWVARDKNNKLYVYRNKPIKSVDEWKLSYGMVKYICYLLAMNYFHL